jgi:hypothetical protein
VDDSKSGAGELTEALACRPSRNGELVEVASGGWVSGPSAGPDTVPEDWPDEEYGVNIIRLMTDYTDFVIMGEAQGYVAYLKGKRSRATGPGVRSASLDGLALAMNRIRRRIDGA